uniref:Mitochondrial carrier protein n=1 Tax=Ciona intestinalis TaxID=7719 RepID=F6Y1V1_CIOIN
ITMVSDDAIRNCCIKLAISSGSAGIAESITFPFDLTKTRLQIQGEVASNSHGTTLVKRRMLRTVYHVASDEGFTKLWSGLSPAVYRQFIYSGCRAPLYEFLREHVLGKNPDGKFSFFKSLLAGATAGAIGQFIASPLDLVKVKMQMVNQKTCVPQKTIKFRSVFHVLQHTYSSGGIKGLWAGWGPNVKRATLVNMGQFATYDNVKQYILKNSKLNDAIACWSLASLCTGFVTSTISTPADVVKTRVMNQTRDSKGRGLFYKSSLECLVKTARQEGFFSLYKGFIPSCLRIVPWNIIFWITQEELRNMFGLSAF